MKVMEKKHLKWYDRQGENQEGYGMKKGQKRKLKGFIIIQGIMYSIIMWMIFSWMENFWSSFIVSVLIIMLYTYVIGKLLRRKNCRKDRTRQSAANRRREYDHRPISPLIKPTNYLEYEPKIGRNKDEKEEKMNHEYKGKNESDWQSHRQRVKNLIEESQKKHVMEKHEKLEEEAKSYQIKVEPEPEPEKVKTSILENGRSTLPNEKMMTKEKMVLPPVVKVPEKEVSIEKKRDEAVALSAKESFGKPSVSLLNLPVRKKAQEDQDTLNQRAMLLEETLESFGVKAKVLNVTQGPAITRYELQPERGVKVSKVTNLSDDIALNMAARSIRIEAPIPGKAAVGIEIPNGETSMVAFRELIETSVYRESDSLLPFAMGKSIAGDSVIFDLTRAPHLLIAGATGSGKSVCINTLILSLLYSAHPNEVKLLLIDPKVVELSRYNGIPHLITPVITDPKKATASLKWAVQEMEERYQTFANAGVRDLEGYRRQNPSASMPYMVIIIDELADLMMVAAKEVEDAICRLAQKARAAGIHLVLATQRPSVDVITGLIKANVPSRIAFSVASQVDSRTILDMAGAEKLLGRGDMLFHPVGANKPVRIQGAFLSDDEVQKTVDYLQQFRSNNQIGAALEAEIHKNEERMEEDELGESEDVFQEALRIAFEQQQISISMLQRKLRMGFNRAARIIDEMEERGYVGPSEGTKPRKVISRSIPSQEE